LLLGIPALKEHEEPTQRSTACSSRKKETGSGSKSNKWMKRKDGADRHKNHCNVQELGQRILALTIIDGNTESSGFVSGPAPDGKKLTMADTR
jgi:hypothetical protein